MAGSEYFDPVSGESFKFGPGEHPPAGWKPLGPISDPLGHFPPGSTVTFAPGKEPRLFVDPSTGETRWITKAFGEPAGWLPLRPRVSPPPQTEDDNSAFDPSTGETFKFGPGQKPPGGWKKLGPVPDPFAGFPPGSTVTWVPGKEPKLYIDPETGKSSWVPWPHAAAPAGWVPAQPRRSPPPLTEHAREFFDPRTGEAHVFEPGEKPPEGWKKLKPIPSPTPGLPPGGTVTFIPGREPKLWIDPQTGEGHWLDPFKVPPAGWVPFTPTTRRPPRTKTSNSWFDPATGESREVGPGQEPPAGWKRIGPIPPQVPDAPPGATIEWPAGSEPQLWIDPATGEPHWVSPIDKPEPSWIKLRPRTMERPQWFDPATGVRRGYGPNETPPLGWKPLQPLPDATPWLPPGASVHWAPGTEPKAYVDPATGETRWVSGGGAPPEGWIPLVIAGPAPYDPSQEPPTANEYDERERAHRVWLRELARRREAPPPPSPPPGHGKLLQDFLDDAALARRKIAELSGYFDTFERHLWEASLAESEKFIRIYQAARPFGLEVAEQAVNDALHADAVEEYIRGSKELLWMGLPIAGGELIGALANTPYGRAVAERLASRASAVAEWVGRLGSRTPSQIEEALSRLAAREALEESFRVAEAGVRISKGARVRRSWWGDPDQIEREMVGARRRVPVDDYEEAMRSYAQQTRAAMAEDAAWKAALFDQGEIGIQGPGNANAPGVDFVTAARNAQGEWRIIATDVKSTTTGTPGEIADTIPGSWHREIVDALSSRRLDLGDPALEAALREAYAAGRVELRRVVVDYSRAGQGKMTGF